MPPYLIGIVFGFMHYSQKFEDAEQSKLAAVADRYKYSRLFRFAVPIFGVITFLSVVFVNFAINRADDVPRIWDMLFIVLSRPIFIIGFSLGAYAIFLGVHPLSAVINHDFWIPFSRLTYGMFLSLEIFMLFRNYNVDRGQWAEFGDTMLFFLAYFMLTCFFSLVSYMMVEAPFKKLEQEFLWKPRIREQKALEKTKRTRSKREDKQPLVEDEFKERKGSVSSEDLEETISRERSTRMASIDSESGKYTTRINS